MTLEKKAQCLWSALSKNKESTTFEHVRELPMEEQMKHPLYPCIKCNGYNLICDAQERYKPAKKYR